MRRNPLVADPLELAAVDRDHARGTAFNMLFIAWRFHTHATAARACVELVEQLHSRFREGVGICTVVEADAVAPSAAARKVLAELLRLPAVSHYSVTYEGAGFRAASFRAVVAGVHALGRSTCKHSVHKSLALAAEWHAEQQAELGRSETRLQIEKAMESLRAKHRQQYP